MMNKKAKIEMETLGKILLLTAFLIIFLLMFKGCRDQMQNVGTVGLNEYLCWLSKTMQADLSFLFPSACYPIDVEEPKDNLGISTLMRKCWWIYGQGDKDIIAGDTNIEKLKNRVITWYDVAGTCYLFTPKEDTNLNEFETYLRNYNKAGKKVEGDSKETTWGYIQKESTPKTGICFDEKLEGKLLKGKRYFVIFYDDRSPISKGKRDRLMISRDPEFGVDQTGLLAWAKERFTNLGCVEWKEQAAKEQEKQRKLCKSYAKEECYKHLDKCYPTFLQENIFTSCEYCKEDFKCSMLLTKTACESNSCMKKCKWEAIPGILKGVCEDA